MHNVRLSKKGNEINEFIFETEQNIDARKMIFFELAKANMPIMGLRQLDASLEDVFMKVITKEEE